MCSSDLVHDDGFIEVRDNGRGVLVDIEPSSGLTGVELFGAPLALEGLMAFFMEATLVGLFFFGWDRLSKVKHLLVCASMAIARTRGIRSERLLAADTTSSTMSVWARRSST